MRIKRNINVRDNYVKFDFDQQGTEFNCKELAALGYVMVCEGDNGEFWIEREPFTGREYDFDKVLVEKVFAEAWTKTQKELAEFREFFDPDKILVRPLQLMYAINESKLTEKYEMWLNSKARTFIERSTFKYISHFSLDDPILQAMFQGIGLDEDGGKALFEFARSIRV